MARRWIRYDRPMTLHRSFCFATSSSRAVLLLLLLCFFFGSLAAASAKDDDDDDGARESISRPNPYKQGCCYSLQNSEKQVSDETLSGRVFPKRVCNSEDGTPTSSDSAVCRQPSLPQPPRQEIRILAANHQSALIQAWILQILTSELLGLPATIESGSPSLNLNFYHPVDAADIPYVEPQVFAAALQQFMTNLQQDSAGEVLDCPQTTNTMASTSPFASSEMCFHIMPQVWEKDLKQLQQLLLPDSPAPAAREGEPPPQQQQDFLDISSLGMLANQGWFLPKRTGLTAAFSLSYFGHEWSDLGQYRRFGRQSIATTTTIIRNVSDAAHVGTVLSTSVAHLLSTTQPFGSAEFGSPESNKCDNNRARGRRSSSTSTAARD